MKIEIHYRNGHYYWVLFDGPDGCDQYEGIASCLGECVEEVVKKDLSMPNITERKYESD